MSITVNLSGKDYQIRMFRETNAFEGFRAYIESELLPILRNIPEISTLRCNHSGIVVAITTWNEIEDCIAAVFRNQNLTRFDDLLGEPATEQQVIDAVESLVDDISIQIMLTWRKSPSLTFSRDGMVTAEVSQQKQLCILLNLFLFDPVQFRTKHADSEDTIGKYRAMAALADEVVSRWNEPIMHSLLEQLVTLDAKYRITKLRLTRKERDRMAALTSESFDAEATLALVRDMVTWRDENSEVYVGQRTWTQEAYRKMNLAMLNREDHSNIVEPAEEMIRIGNKLVKKATDPEGIAKQEAKIERANILSAIFGNRG